MKKKLVFLSTIALSLILSNCGGGNSSSGNIETAYYVDSAVEGVNYHCGSQSGVTNSDGSFNYISSEDCTLFVGDIHLRTVKSNDLYNGKYVVEDNIDVARFLQSLDNDGNPNNGILIDKDVAKALKMVLKENKIPKDEDLEELVARLHNEVPHYNGHTKDKDEVKEHLHKTQEEAQKHNQEINKQDKEHKQEHL